MAGIIDPDGLFNGDRLDLVSDTTRLAFPFLWLASNSYGRIELNYHRVIGRAFSRFRRKPTEEEFWEWISELNIAFLLFIYKVNGTLWGQFATSEKFLPRHKLTADRRSPAPDHALFTAWKEQYITDKKARNASKPLVPNNFKNLSETPQQSFENPVEIFRSRVGVGEGIGINTCASPNGNARQIEAHQEQPSAQDNQNLGPRAEPGTSDNGSGGAGLPSCVPSGLQSWVKEDWFEEWWPEYWRKKAKKEARVAFLKHVKTEGRFQQVMAATRAQQTEMMERLPQNRPYPTTWLNGERWEDEPDRQAQTVTSDDYPEFPQ